MVLGIFGAGGLGREVLEIARLVNKKSERWDEIVFIDDAKMGLFVNGVNVYSYVEAKRIFGTQLEVVIGIGEPATRERLFNEIKEESLISSAIIHPDVYIPETTTVKKGTVINVGSFISCNVTIGENAYVQPHTNVGHDCVIGDGCILSGFSNIAGSVNIGKYTYLGLGACVKESVTIGEYSIIGMSSSVYKDIPDGVIAIGNPARPMKNNEDRKVFK